MIMLISDALPQKAALSASRSQLKLRGA